ncbi:hypothetical protein [Longimicrobium terrae]|uniref:Uncharacterized protein n=1 Tax=Longimicrobium terrae TaxID=1639882 RepID=A0A841GXI8_9BACT|nr:hypothetical protein [Longimicrobium terrae]MBB4636076.1 hypothetical protein [Longimicrobium terrae]MBB6070471.1 hypothetical protein [Longimicrobium terrae]NNC29462.1 hypothetical protein [Longimicrobium terrae]
MMNSRAHRDPSSGKPKGVLSQNADELSAVACPRPRPRSAARHSWRMVRDWRMMFIAEHEPAA